MGERGSVTGGGTAPLSRIAVGKKTKIFPLRGDRVHCGRQTWARAAGCDGGSAIQCKKKVNFTISVIFHFIFIIMLKFGRIGRFVRCKRVIGSFEHGLYGEYYVDK